MAHSFGATNFTGNVTVGESATARQLRLNGPAGSERMFIWLTAGNARWIAYANESAESGSNAGSNFALAAYNDAGSFLSNVISIVRAAGGAITLNRPVTISGSNGLTVGGNATVSGGTVTAGVSGATRGVLKAFHGAGGNTPGYVLLYSPNGTPWYVFAEDDGTLKIHNAVPTANTDGTVVGTQT
jgi:hypothetical protein